jgi:glycosyltransferase 2 family protein
MWKLGWRLGVASVLLFWIFHAIFLLEGRQHWQEQGLVWEELERLEQWQIAWRQGPSKLWQTLQLIHPGAFLLSLVFMGMTIALGVVRWRLVLKVQGLDLSLGRTAEISIVAHFFNSFLLGSTGGDLLKAYYAARETRHKKTEAVMTVLADRILGLFAMLLFATIMMLFNLALILAFRRMAAVSLMILILLAGCALILVLSFWGGVSKKWPEARAWLRRLPKGDLLEKALDACRQFGLHPVALVKMLGLSMALNLFCVLQILALARGLGLEVPFGVLLFVVPVVVCLSAIPVTPSGLGIRENLYVYLLAVLGVEATLALSLSLLAYAGFLAWSILGGIVYVTRKDRDRLAELAEPKVLPEEQQWPG